MMIALEVINKMDARRYRDQDSDDESLTYEEVMDMEDAGLMTEEMLKNGIEHAVDFDHHKTLFALMHADAAHDLGEYGRNLVNGLISLRRIEALSALIHSAYELGHLAGIPNGPEVEKILNLPRYKDTINSAVKLIGLSEDAEDVLGHICAPEPEHPTA